MNFFFKFIGSILNFSKIQPIPDHWRTLVEATYRPVHDPTKLLADYAVLQKSNDTILPEYTLAGCHERDSWQTTLQHDDRYGEAYKLRFSVHGYSSGDDMEANHICQSNRNW